MQNTIKKSAFRRLRQNGFSLIEMAVVLAISGTLAASFLTITSAQQEASNYQVTAQRLDAIEDAIDIFVNKTGYLPCVAPSDDAETTATFAISSDCTQATPPDASIVDIGTGSNTIWVGTVPTRSLNLPDKYYFDGWGNRFTYVVIKDQATTADAFENYSTTATNGVIQILDRSNNQVTPADTKSIVSYVIVSHGKDGLGSYNRSGNISKACSSSSKDMGNCDRSNITFVDTPVTGKTDVAANYYDDVIRWASKSKLEMSTSSTNTAATVPDAAFDGEDRLDVGYGYSCGLKQDGTAYCWGNDTSGTNRGLLGMGSFQGGTDVLTPSNGVVAGGYTDWDVVKTDLRATCGIRSGSLYCWGGNGKDSGGTAHGSLGLGNFATTDYHTPQQVSPTVTDWIDLDVDGYYACALRSIGRLYCWGENTWGNLGDNTTVDKNVPTQVRDTAGTGSWSDWTKFSVGTDNTCAIRSNGRLYCWGDNTTGELGNGTRTQTSRPVEVSGGFSDWVYIAGEHQHNCGIRNSNRAYCWGANGSGQVGTGSTSTDEITPQLVTGGITNWKKIKLNGATSCGLTYSGSVLCWGGNAAGQLGDGTTTPRSAPATIINGSSGWIDLTHQCAINSARKAFCWGNNQNGKLGSGSDVPSYQTTPTELIGFTF